MLKLSKITKEYKAADMEVKALKGLDISFRSSEFVSVLGPSGCGKTTLLNIVGGLDKYSSGDLFINGRSTKEFKDKDWDVYRNRKVGFVFQSYNLIPHQTVLGNVELALTIAGMSKAERTAKAKKALDNVGLNGLYNKRPNQLSGGQCQRVAIARALVNDPEILLADEPTGALDSVTSVQIMEIIKEISKNRLVIMVTHNGELAEQYSTRIVRLLDGELLSDSNPYSEKQEAADIKKRAEKKAKVSDGKPKKIKAKMSLWTAFKLSLQNLFTKKARTIMTSIAGSIGIIGVSLVLSMSFGVQSYIASMQNDMLSGNPITITKTAFDLSGLMKSMSTQEKEKLVRENGYVNVDAMMEYLAERAANADSMRITNNITQEYIDFVEDMPPEYVASIFLDYGIDITNNLYTDFSENATDPSVNVSLSAIRTIYTAILVEAGFGSYASYVTSLSEVFMQAPSDEDYIMSQYNKLTGSFANTKNEVMIVLDSNSELTDLLLAQLGYYTQEEFINLVYKVSDDADYDSALDIEKFSYGDLLGKTFTWYPNDTILEVNTNPLTNMMVPFNYNAYNTGSLTGGEQLTIVGILEPKETVSYGSLTSGFYYTEALTEHIIATNLNSQVVQYIENILEPADKDAIVSMEYVNPTTGVSVPTGIIFNYSFTYKGTTHPTNIGYFGAASSMSALLGGLGIGGNSAQYYTASKQQLGGVDMAQGIAIYPVDFTQKDFVLKYLDKWNSTEDIVVNGVTLTAADRDKITYTDNLSLVISLVNTFIEIVTYALVGFTALALVVSCVMIGIITYVSVVERVKEIGVIRSLGGRKKDVSYLFNAETFIIGLTSGAIGILVTYLLSGIINLIVGSLSEVPAIALFPWHYALIMLGISVLLTLISGLIPSRSAAKKDPVVALRTE